MTVFLLRRHPYIRSSHELLIHPVSKFHEPAKIYTSQTRILLNGCNARLGNASEKVPLRENLQPTHPIRKSPYPNPIPVQSHSQLSTLHHSTRNRNAAAHIAITLQHLVSAAPPPSGVTIEEIVDVAAEPAPFLFTGVEEEEHISTGVVICGCMTRNSSAEISAKFLCKSPLALISRPNLIEGGVTTSSSTEALHRIVKRLVALFEGLALRLA